LANFNETVTIKVFPGVTMLQSPKRELSCASNTNNAIAYLQESKAFPQAL
jgi:hypothetical protein